MKVNQKGINLVKHFEGVRLKAYVDPVGILTIGYGHTGRDVKPGQKITLQKAEDLLKADLEHAAKGVRKKLQVELNENQFSALTSFTYNVGIGALSRSTLLRKLNAGDFSGAAREFGKWVNGTINGRKVPLPGLVRRRKAERALFEESVAGTAIAPVAIDEKPADEAFFYIVRPGETLVEIARENGLTVETLLGWNPQIADPNLIFPGDLLQFNGGPPQAAEPAAKLVVPDGSSPWYEIARQEVGVTEDSRTKRNNARILEYHQSTSLDKNLARHDETPWCSSFANWCIQSAGIKGTRSARARSWLKWGEPLEEPREGCIVVFARPKAGPKAGHVGFYAGPSGDRIRVLGGNQSNSVKISRYSRKQLLGFRWPRSIPKTIAPIEDKAEENRSYYLVQPGDTLAGIARRNGATLQQLMGWNPQIAKPSLIFPGDMILLVDVQPQAAEPEPIPAGTQAPWYVLAERELGVKERKGVHNNNRILEYHRSTTLSDDLARIDETPWCSSFVNWCVTQAGLAGTNSARARSWSKWGRKLRKPRPGCIVVLSRPRAGPDAGHVGFYAGETATRIKLLGGNQSDSVNIASYPRSRLIGYRWTDEQPSPDAAKRRRPFLSGLRILRSQIAALGRRRP